ICLLQLLFLKTNGLNDLVIITRKILINITPPSLTNIKVIIKENILLINVNTQSNHKYLNAE
ncbi:unnamed protein product, partial [marine sediment metagenome]